MSTEKATRITSTKSYKKSVLLTSLARDNDDSIRPTATATSSLPFTLALPPPEATSLTPSSGEIFYSVLKIPFIGRAPIKTVCVPRAIVEPEPPTVKTAKTVLCSYKVTQTNRYINTFRHSLYVFSL